MGQSFESCGVGDLRIDYCRFGTAWRKRTRFRTNLHLAGQTDFCKCARPHLRLRGRCRERKVNFTQLAEAYPRAVANMLGAAAAIDCGVSGATRKLDVAGCAKCASRCIGEALNPGPRRVMPRDVSLSLADINMLEPGTIAIRSRIWHDFEVWVNLSFGAGFVQRATAVSPLFAQLLLALGYHCFDTNVS